MERSSKFEGKEFASSALKTEEQFVGGTRRAYLGRSFVGGRRREKKERGNYVLTTFFSRGCEFVDVAVFPHPSALSDFLAVFFSRPTSSPAPPKNPSTHSKKPPPPLSHFLCGRFFPFVAGVGLPPSAYVWTDESPFATATPLNGDSAPR